MIISNDTASNRKQQEHDRVKRRKFIKQAAAVATTAALMPATALTPLATDAEKWSANKRVIGRMTVLPGSLFADDRYRTVYLPLDENEIAVIPVPGTGMVYRQNGKHHEDEITIGDGKLNEYSDFLQANGKSMFDPPFREVVAEAIARR